MKRHSLGPRQIDLLVYLAHGAAASGVKAASITELAVSCGFVDRWGAVHRANCRAAMRTLVARGLVKCAKQGRPKGWRPAVWHVTKAGFAETKRLGGSQ